MTVDHCTDDQLSLHVLQPDDLVARHVASCETCSKRLAFHREIDSLLRMPGVWDGADRAKHTSAMSKFEAARFQVDAEDSRAREMLAPLVVSVGAFTEHSVASNRRYHSAGVVRVLTREARRNRDSAPKLALTLATAATAIASKVGRSLRAETTGNAWLERGIVEFLLGQYANAQLTLTTAEEALERAGDHARWDLANVWLTRANLYVETGRLDDALDWAARAGDVFLSYDDLSRALRSWLIRGTVLYSSGAHDDAIKVFESMLAEAERIDDRKTCARALHNAANCYLAKSDFSVATEYYLRALALWDELRSDAEIVRTRWSLATIDVARGKWKLGFKGLQEAQRQLNALGLLNDEGLVRIEMAEVLILLGRHREVAPLLEGIVLHFANGGMMRNAQLALAWLTEANRLTRPTVAELKHVRDYLRRLPTHPSESFRPPS